MYLTAAEFQPVNFHRLILQQRLENTIILVVFHSRSRRESSFELPLNDGVVSKFVDILLFLGVTVVFTLEGDGHVWIAKLEAYWSWM